MSTTTNNAECTKQNKNVSFGFFVWMLLSNAYFVLLFSISVVCVLGAKHVQWKGALYSICLYSIWYLHKTHQTACQCPSLTCSCSPPPPFPFISLNSLHLSSQTWPKTKNGQKNFKNLLSVTSWVVVAGLPSFLASHFSPFIFPFQRLLFSVGHKWQRIYLYLSNTVNRWGKKKKPFSHLC